MKKKPGENPAPSFKWRPFLKKVSREQLKEVGIREDLPDDVIASAWLGYAGATGDEIAALEKRLGKVLPTSYRTFLAETNGWRHCGPFIYKLWSCAEVAWFRERNQDWIDAYVHPERYGVESTDSANQLPVLTDDEYLVYGEEQDSCKFRPEYLRTALEISDIGDSAIVLLNPEVINEAGEWEAWLFANWMPGACRYRSFRELMQAEHESLRQLHKEQGSGKSKYGNAAQQAACRGETAKALILLRKLTASADASSAVSLAELCAFLGLWDEVITSFGQVLGALHAIPNFDGYLFHLLQLLGRAGQETGQWEQISELTSTAIAAEKNRDEHSNFVDWFERLLGYCQRRGQPPHKFLDIYEITDPFDQLDEGKRQAHYEQALKGARASRLKDKPAEYTGYRFALAKVMELDAEMIRIYEEMPSAIYFNSALEVSRAYIKRGDEESAWAVLRDRLHQSVNGLPEQIAPIILFIDDALRSLMTPERCRFVLSTPRGRQAPPT